MKIDIFDLLSCNIFRITLLMSLEKFKLCVICSVLIAVLIRPAQNEMHLLWVSYGVFSTFLLLEILLSYLNDTRLVMAPTMLFTYISYSLLPVRLQIAIIAGLVLCTTQMVTFYYMDSSITKEKESVSKPLS